MDMQSEFATALRVKPLMLPLGEAEPTEVVQPAEPQEEAVEQTRNWLDVPIVEFVTPTFDKATRWLTAWLTTWATQAPRMAWTQIRKWAPHKLSPWVLLVGAACCAMALSSLAAIVNTVVSVAAVLWAVHFAWKRVGAGSKKNEA